MNALDRRSLMRALGLSGVGTLLPSLRGARRAHAAMAIPKRFVVFYTHQGELIPQWKPRGVNGAEPTETAWALSELHKPLEPYKSKLVLMSGLDMKSVDFGKSGNAHQTGEQHSLSPWRPVGTEAGGITIDQYISEGINKGGLKTLLPYLHLETAASGGATGSSSPSFKVGGQPIPSERAPLAVYQRLFPNGQTTPGTTPVNDARNLQQKSALDFIAKEFDAARAGLGSIDRTKLESHAQAVRDLEMRLSQQPTIAAGCPKFDESTLKPALNTSARDAKTWFASSDQMVRLIQVALACDLTRVVNIGIAFPHDEATGYSKGAFGTIHAHDLEHGTARNGALASNASAQAISLKARTLQVQLFAKLLGLLDSIEESDGQTLLDHTVVLWCGQIGDGGHATRNLKWMLAGSAGGGLRTGRYLSFGPYDRKQYDKERGRPHSDMFAALANAVGVPTETFGLPEACNGPLLELS